MKLETPAWIDEAREEFEQLREIKRREKYPHVQKMIDTIIALVNADLSGESMASAFKRPETCAQNTYYEKWKKDPAFARCLENVKKLARKWHDGRVLRALDEASEKLIVEAPEMVGRLQQAIMRANLQGDNRTVIYGVINWLDRAGTETAVKNAMQVGMDPDTVETVKDSIMSKLAKTRSAIEEEQRQSDEAEQEEGDDDGNRP
jgi:hypothetical protein